jgi:hypothetical protein
MKKLLPLIVLIFPLLFSGCLRTYYPIGFSVKSSPIIFQDDDEKSYSKYIGGEVSTMNGYHKFEKVQIVRGLYTTAYTTDHTNFNSELFFFFSNYKVNGVSESLDGNKLQIGICGEIKFAINLKINKLKAGIGLNAGFRSEYGEYSIFRNHAGNQNKISTSDGEPLFMPNFSLFPFVAFPISKSLTLSTQINIGFPDIISPNIMISSKNISGWISIFINGESEFGLLDSKLLFGMKFRL